MSELTTFAVTTASAGGACLGEVKVITVSGDDDVHTFSELERALESIYEDGGRHVAVDLSAVEAIDGGRWLDVLLDYRSRFRDRGGDIVIACTNSTIDAQDPTFRIEPRIEDAIASLLSTGRP